MSAKVATSQPVPGRLDLALAYAAWSLGVSRRTLGAFAACAVLALLAIWVPRYPVGVDLPQHANMFRLWTELLGGPLEYRHMYRVEPFTPYLLTYVVAFPLTFAFGAVAATKCLLSFGALATPVMLARWLKTVGARPAFGLVGYVVAFDYGYLWGFISYTCAIPLMFAYFVAVLRQPERPGLAEIALASLLGTLLFFSHGIIFGFSICVVGLTLVFQGRWVRRFRRGLHLLPMAACALYWLTHKPPISNWHPTDEWFTPERALTLFSGSFVTMPDRFWAWVGGAGVLVFLLLARPKLSFSTARIVPVALALVAFVAIPNWMFSTWLVGSRCAVFVHALAPAIIIPRESDWVARRWRSCLFVLVAAFLVLLGVRLLEFNQEIAGCRELARFIPPGTDLRTLVTATDLDSKVFGELELGQVPAWITAEQGGMLENDSGTTLYYQVPLRRRDDVEFPSAYRFDISYGAFDRYAETLQPYTAGARLVRTFGDWLLFERKPIKTRDYFVVRSGQSDGELKVNRAASGHGLSVAGVAFPKGLGAQARSFARLRFVRPATRFEGACGVDDGAGGAGRAKFRIRSDKRGTLFESGVVKSGEAVRRFSVALAGETELLLEVLPAGTFEFGHGDWVDLALR
jgi:hypothetical protein